MTSPFRIQSLLGMATVAYLFSSTYFNQKIVTGIDERNSDVLIHPADNSPSAKPTQDELSKLIEEKPTLRAPRQVKKLLKEVQKMMKHRYAEMEKTYKSPPRVTRKEDTRMMTLKESRGAKQQTVLLSTFVYGEKQANLRRLEMFVQTAATSGFDYVIVGDPAPSFPLPPNVIHVHVTWAQLVDRLVQKVFDGGKGIPPEKIQALRKASPYKVCEYKPLFAYLFPELVEGYTWWGHVDNDMLMGSVSHMLPNRFLSQVDIFSGCVTCDSWGPFMMYRNADVVNTLFMKAAEYQTLESLFLTPDYYFFDEWSNIKPWQQLTLPPNPASMTKIIQHYAEELGLKTDKLSHKKYAWDMFFCRKSDFVTDRKPLPPRCAECTYNMSAAGDRKLILSQKNASMMFCHFEGSKTAMDKSLDEDPAGYAEMLRRGEFVVNYNNGFELVPEDYHPGLLKKQKKKNGERQ